MGAKTTGVKALLTTWESLSTDLGSDYAIYIGSNDPGDMYKIQMAKDKGRDPFVYTEHFMRQRRKEVSDFIAQRMAGKLKGKSLFNKLRTVAKKFKERTVKNIEQGKTKQGAPYNNDYLKWKKKNYSPVKVMHNTGKLARNLASNVRKV